MMHADSKKDDGDGLLQFLLSLGWPYGVDDINPEIAANFKEHILGNLQLNGVSLPLAEQSLALDLINKFTENLRLTSGREPRYCLGSPDVNTMENILSSYGFELQLQKGVLHREAMHLCKQVEHCGNIAGLIGLRKAMGRDPEKWIFRR